MTQVEIDTPQVGMFCVHTFCVVAVSVFVACSRSFITEYLRACSHILCTHHSARSLPCNRLQLALSPRCLPSASTYSLYCIAQYMYIRTGSAFVAVRSCTFHCLFRYAYIPHTPPHVLPMHTHSPFSFLLGTHSLASAHSHSGTRAPWCCSLVLVNMSMFAPSEYLHRFSRLALLTRLAWVCSHSPPLTVYACGCACECKGFHTLTPCAKITNFPKD